MGQRGPMVQKHQNHMLVRQGEHKKDDLQVPSPTMQFTEFGDHLDHQTTSYRGLDVVGYQANRIRKRVKSFGFKIRHSGRETKVPRPQPRVVVAPKGPSYGFSPWEAPERACWGAPQIPFVAHLNTMLWWPNSCQWSCQLAHTSCEQARCTLCTSNRVVDYIALLIVGRKGVSTSIVANWFALLRGYFG